MGQGSVGCEFLVLYGQELNERTWYLTKTNLMIHGMDTVGLGSRLADTFTRDMHPGGEGEIRQAILRADEVSCGGLVPSPQEAHNVEHMGHQCSTVYRAQNHFIGES